MVLGYALPPAAPSPPFPVVLGLPLPVVLEPTLPVVLGAISSTSGPAAFRTKRESSNEAVPATHRRELLHLSAQRDLYIYVCGYIYI